MLIVALNGSPNKEGNTAHLLNCVLDICKQNGADTELVHVNEVMSSLKNPFCTVCSSSCMGSCYKGTVLEEVFELMKQADCIILGSPVYFGTVSAQIKAFFDKSRGLRQSNAFLGKIGAAVTVGRSKYGGQETTIKALHDIMLVHGMTIVGDGCIEEDCGHYGVCATVPANEDEYAQKRARILAMRILATCRK